MQFVDQHKYQDNERAVYTFVNEHAPKTIVELGYGSGALTVAMVYGSENVTIHSYDLESPDTALRRLRERNLQNKCNMMQGDAYELFINKPFEFDLLLIDLHNTWEIVYNIVINNKFINTCIRNGAHVIIEGGADAHPRMNINTLNAFHKSIGKEVFSYKHLSGQRTSLSVLNIL